MLGLLSMLFGIGGSLLITISFQNSLKQERESACHMYQTVLETLQIVNDVNNQFAYEDIINILRQLSGQNRASWAALKLHNNEQTIFQEGKISFAVLETEAEPGHCTVRYRLSEEEGEFLILSGALGMDEETLYLDMAFDLSALFQVRDIQQRVYQGVFLLLVLLCAVLSYSLSRILTRPLSELREASQAISVGELSRRAKVYSEDEVGKAARDFNAMAEILESNISELRELVERQERFVGSFAHEAKTPMTSIIGYADLIRGQMLNEEEQLDAANFIVAEGRRLEHLSQKLLELLLVKQGQITFVSTNPAALIRGLAAHLEQNYKSQGITIACDCEDGECLLEPELVKSLLINLWDNARKAMEGQESVLFIRSVMLSDGVQISVWDNGRGIPQEALTHLTEAFYRVDKSRSRAQGGVGLGLALCQEIVSLHDGSIRFESELGQGTTVTVILRGGVVSCKKS